MACAVGCVCLHIFFTADTFCIVYKLSALDIQMTRQGLLEVGFP